MHDDKNNKQIQNNIRTFKNKFLIKWASNCKENNKFKTILGQQQQIYYNSPKRKSVFLSTLMSKIKKNQIY